MESFIRQILRRGMEEDKIDKLFSDENSIEYFRHAFTTKAFDVNNNYEFFEQLGDISINKFIVEYIGRRFPQLRSSEGVGVIATIRIQYVSKDLLSQLSAKLGFDKFIRFTDQEILEKHKFQNILEDVFEAFFGALEFTINKKWFVGLGYIYVYKILESIYDDLNIDINYENLVDAKTRLNEIVVQPDLEKRVLIRYENRHDKFTGIYRTTLFINNDNAVTGEGLTKKISENIAAEQAIKKIEKIYNIKKAIPRRFHIVSKNSIM